MTGARLGETTGPAWENVDLDARAISFEKQYTDARGRESLKRPAGVRAISVDDGMTPGLLADWRRDEEAFFRVKGVPFTRESPVCCNDRASRQGVPQPHSRLLRRQDGQLAGVDLPGRRDGQLVAQGRVRAARRGERPWIRSDRGCRWRWPGWVAICEGSGAARSVSAKGCSPDNSACEGLFGRTRVEMLYGHDWSGVGMPESMDGLGEHIEWYDDKGIKMTLGGMSPSRHRSSMGLAA